MSAVKLGLLFDMMWHTHTKGQAGTKKGLQNREILEYIVVRGDQTVMGHRKWQHPLVPTHVPSCPKIATKQLARKQY